MKYTTALVGTPQRTDSKGFETVRLRITFNKYKVYINLGFRWNNKHISPDGLLQGPESFKKYSEAIKVINEHKTDIQKAFADYEIETPSDLKLRLQNHSSTDFIEYAKRKLLERHAKLEIQYSTYRVQSEAFVSLSEFMPKLPFNKINVQMLEYFKAFLKNKGLERNTIWTRLKDIRTYMNTAKKEGIKFDYPFGSDFKMPKAQSRLNYLSEAEFQKLKTHYQTLENPHQKKVLKAFLFACYAGGMRITDICTIKGKAIQGDTLKFEPSKGKHSETKKFTEIEIPLHDFAVSLLPAKYFKEERIFSDLPNKNEMNLRLKEIAKDCKVKPFSFHWSRHTFAIRFLAAGGKIEVLQKLLGHESIKTTMIYVHIEPTTAKNQINLLT